jgi:hypothetical protein
MHAKPTANTTAMTPQPTRIHDFRMRPLRSATQAGVHLLPLITQTGERLRFVLGTNTFWHKGKLYSYGDHARPNWHACLYSTARRGIEVDCFWLAGTMRIKVLLHGEVLFSHKLMIYRGESSSGVSV